VVVSYRPKYLLSFVYRIYSRRPPINQTGVHSYTKTRNTRRNARAVQGPCKDEQSKTRVHNLSIMIRYFFPFHGREYTRITLGKHNKRVFIDNRLPAAVIERQLRTGPGRRREWTNIPMAQFFDRRVTWTARWLARS